MNARRLIAALLLAAVALSACAPKAGGAEAEVQGVVREYDGLLAQAFARQDMNALAPVATHEQAQEEYYQMAALGEGRLRLLATLRSLRFGETTFPAKDKALVMATEVWDYRQVSIDTSAVVRTETGVTYRLRYELVRAEGRWRVSAVTSTDATGSAGTTSAP